MSIVLNIMEKLRNLVVVEESKKELEVLKKDIVSILGDYYIPMVSLRKNKIPRKKKKELNLPRVEAVLPPPKVWQGYNSSPHITSRSTGTLWSGRKIFYINDTSTLTNDKYRYPLVSGYELKNKVIFTSDEWGCLALPIQNEVKDIPKSFMAVLKHSRVIHLPLAKSIESDFKGSKMTFDGVLMGEFKFPYDLYKDYCKNTYMPYKLGYKPTNATVIREKV